MRTTIVANIREYIQRVCCTFSSTANVNVMTVEGKRQTVLLSHVLLKWLPVISRHIA